MALWWKPGIGLSRKIKSNGRRRAILLVFCAWLLASVACNLPTTARLTPGAGQGGVEETPPPWAVALTATAESIAATQNIALATLFAPTATPSVSNTPRPPLLYYTQSGDTMEGVAARFGVQPGEITSPKPLVGGGFLNPGQLLMIPDVLDGIEPMAKLLPDCEVVYSACALDFNIENYVNQAGGYLSRYTEYLDNRTYTGSEIVEKVAVENSLNPRLILALIEYQGHWVFGDPQNLAETDYPLGWIVYSRKGLYKQLTWAVHEINRAYFGWRSGSQTAISFANGDALRLNPQINAGTAALLSIMARVYSQMDWAGVTYGTDSLPILYEQMFGSPWQRAQSVEPLITPNLEQPNLELPYRVGHAWSYTGGPHPVWGEDSPFGALDFAPPDEVKGCTPSLDWVTAPAPGLVIRSDNGVVVLDLDGDGYDQTGWTILLLHIATEGRVNVGTWVEQDGKIGHPSCEGGSATGRHVHIARKYNGEWMLADGPIPFIMSGWRAYAGDAAYEGTIIRGEEIIRARSYGSSANQVYRYSENP